MFDDIKKAINIIHDLPQSIKSITMELNALSEIKNELNIQKEKLAYNEKLIDNIKGDLNTYFFESKEHIRELRQELTETSHLQTKYLEDFKASFDERETNQEAFRNNLNKNITETHSSLEKMLNKLDALRDNATNITHKNDVLIDGLEKSSIQIANCITKTCNIESLLNDVLSKKIDENNKFIQDNISTTKEAIKTHSESMIAVTDILKKIHDEMQSMDNSARLILLASVVSELDKSIDSSS